jgi:hypothetical protein
MAIFRPSSGRTGSGANKRGRKNELCDKNITVDRNLPIYTTNLFGLHTTAGFSVFISNKSA